MARLLSWNSCFDLFPAWRLGTHNPEARAVIVNLLKAEPSNIGSHPEARNQFWIIYKLNTQQLLALFRGLLLWDRDFQQEGGLDTHPAKLIWLTTNIRSHQFFWVLRAGIYRGYILGFNASVKSSFFNYLSFNCIYIKKYNFLQKTNYLNLKLITAIPRYEYLPR